MSRKQEKLKALEDKLFEKLKISKSERATSRTQQHSQQEQSASSQQAKQVQAQPFQQVQSVSNIVQTRSNDWF